MILVSYPKEPQSSVVFYSGQKALQTALILLAVICIPWMLLGKPIYRIMMNKRRANVSQNQITNISLESIENKILKIKHSMQQS